MTRSPLPTLLLTASAALAVSGCGGNDRPTTTQGSVGTPTSPGAMTTGNRPASGTGAAARRAYAQDGRPATKAEAAEVRASLKAFADALTDRDAPALCAHATGFDELPDADASCASLFANAGSTTGPSKSERRQIATAAVVVDGDRATADLGTGPPLPLRRIDGRWKIDYATMVSAAAPSTAPNAN